MTREQKIEEACIKRKEALRKSYEACLECERIVREATDDPEPSAIPERIKWLREGYAAAAAELSDTFVSSESAIGWAVGRYPWPDEKEAPHD